MARKVLVPLDAPSLATDAVGGRSTDLKLNTALNANGNAIWGTADPVNADWVANKKYVDRSGIFLDPVRAATTVNITLSGTQTIDTIAVVAGNRVLVKDQTTASQNGIYVVAAGAWTRASDADTAAEMARSARVMCLEGSNHKFRTFTQIATLTTLGTDSVLWRVLANVDQVGSFTIPAPQNVGHMVYNVNNKSLLVWNGFYWDDAYGFTVCTSTTRPTFMGDGHRIYETDTGLAYYYADGQWRTSGGGGGSGTDEVWVGPDAPADPNIELWYDSDAVSSVTPNDTGWLPLAYEGGATDLSSVSYPGMYRRLNGVVYLRGLMKVGTSVAIGTVIATLPVGFRPASVTHYSAPASTSSVTRLNIRPDNGAITINYTGAPLVASSSWIGVDHCSFPADA